ncbi:hypothetical protein BT96DRAFT_798235, partial [Gymnopus androsaceus JB14]
MPGAIPAWRDAMLKIGETFDHNRHPPSGIPSGYVLPEVYMFAHSDNDVLRQKFMKTYLKLYPAISYRISSLGSFNMLKAASDWRKLIGLELHGTKTDSKAAEQRRKLVDELQKSLNLVDLSNLQAIVPWWDGVEYPAHIPDDVFRHVLWNTINMSFKLELLMANFIFYE